MGSISEFQAWARAHAHEVDGQFDDSLASANLESFISFREIIGDARVVAIGEPFHGAHEPLALRNLLIRYCITELGFTAVALETGVSPSKRLYDYVLGKTAEPDSALAASFSYGFGKHRENLELLHWLRTYNVGQPPSARVRLYGVDMTGQVFPYAHRSLDAVLIYLDSVDSSVADQVRAELQSAIGDFRIDRFIELPETERTSIAVKINDLVTLMRRRRVDFTAATSRDEYDWALRQALSAAQDVAYMRLAPPEWVRLVNSGTDVLPDAQALLAAFGVRESSFTDNLAWVLEREGPHARVVFFAHNAHLQGHPLAVPVDHGFYSLLIGAQFAGMHLRSALQEDLVVVGTHFGEATAFPSARQPLEPLGLEAILASPAIGTYVIDLRALPAGTPLADSFGAEQVVRSMDSGNIPAILRPSRAYEAILYIERVTPARL